MSSQETGQSFFTRRVILNSVAVGAFLISMGAIFYWLNSGEPEKRLARARMVEELRKEQLTESGVPVGFDVTPLVDEAYARFLLKDLAGARESIDVLMFEIKMGKTDDNPVNRLVSELIIAKDRGVRVRLRLEQSELDRSLTRYNRRTAELLKPHAIPVDFDLPSVETHAKVVLIDGRILYVGNHNWSSSAMTRNKEISLRVESPVPVSAMRRYFDRFDRDLQKRRLDAAG